MRAAAPWGVLVALAAPAPTWALGLGDIAISSALNQPFRASIGLTASAEELSTLRIGLADNAAFSRAGLDRPSFMSNFEFNVSTDAAGNSVITVSSNRPVAEPFVTMIVEAAWSRGAVSREYTVFLDPPVLLPTPSLATTVTPAQTGVNSAAAPAAPIARPPAQSQQPVTRPATQSAAPAPRAADNGDTYGPVRPAETLWEIAQRYQAPGATMNQTMVAIYSANPAAFGGNMNVLRVGATLRIPSRNEFLALDVASATAEVRRQSASWRNQVEEPPRLELVPPSPESTIAQSRQAAPATNAANDDGGAVAELRGELAALRAELAESRRLIQLRDQELSELQDQLTAFAAAAANPPASTASTAPAAEPPAQSEVEADDSHVFADEPADAATPAEEPAPEATPASAIPAVAAAPAAEQSMLARMLGLILSPIALIVAGGVAALLAGFWFVRRRGVGDEHEDVTGHWDAIEAGMDEQAPKRAAFTPAAKVVPEPAEEDLPFIVEERGGSASTTLPIDEPEAIAAEQYARATSEDPSIDDTLSTSAVINLDEADPIAEADFHMAYGLYDQAADLLTTELSKEPDRRDLHLKLLEVYFVWGNKSEFLSAAQKLRNLIGNERDSDWDKVLIMGKQICPDASIFADSKTAAAGAESSSADSLDFAFDESGENAIDLDIGDATRSAEAANDFADMELDLDLTGSRRALEATDMLDIGAATAANLEDALKDEDDDVSVATGNAPTELVAEFDPESLIETQESPRLEGIDDDDVVWADETVESPTIEHMAGASHADDVTMQAPAAEAEATQLRQTAIIDPSDRARRARETAGAEFTAEIDVNELGLDVDDLEGLNDDLDALAQELGVDTDLDEGDGDTREQPVLDVEIDQDFLTATGITQVLEEQSADKFVADANAETQASRKAPDAAAALAIPEGSSGMATEIIPAPGATRRRRDAEVDLDELVGALGEGSTVEQTGAADESSTTMRGSSFVDLDIGEEFGDEEEPTATEDMRAIDPQTLTEVGTKLDLARAYIDMGDPDGAKSILEEVMAEGDLGQREEARTLMRAIGE